MTILPAHNQERWKVEVRAHSRRANALACRPRCLVHRAEFQLPSLPAPSPGPRTGRQLRTPPCRPGGGLLSASSARRAPCALPLPTRTPSAASTGRSESSWPLFPPRSVSGCGCPSVPRPPPPSYAPPRAQAKLDPETCSALIDFSVPGKPNPPPCKLTATLWAMRATGLSQFY